MEVKCRTLDVGGGYTQAKLTVLLWLLHDCVHLAMGETNHKLIL